MLDTHVRCTIDGNGRKVLHFRPSMKKAGCLERCFGLEVEKKVEADGDELGSTGPGESGRSEIATLAIQNLVLCETSLHCCGTPAMFLKSFCLLF